VCACNYSFHLYYLAIYEQSAEFTNKRVKPIMMSDDYGIIRMPGQLIILHHIYLRLENGVALSFSYSYYFYSAVTTQSKKAILYFQYNIRTIREP
jgi:hypothetical protein